MIHCCQHMVWGTPGTFCVDCFWPGPYSSLHCAIESKWDRELEEWKAVKVGGMNTTENSQIWQLVF